MSAPAIAPRGINDEMREISFASFGSSMLAHSPVPMKCFLMPGRAPEITDWSKPLSMPLNAAKVPRVMTSARVLFKPADNRAKAMRSYRDSILHILLALLVLHLDLVFQLGRGKGDILGVLDVLVVGVCRFTHVGCTGRE